MKRVVILVLALCLLLCACNSQSEDTQPSTTEGTTAAPTTEPATVPTTVPPTTEAPTEPATEPTAAPTEPQQLYTHPITGETLAEPVTNRPVAVVINNIRAAQPLYGIGQADWIYELTAEGGGTITRLLPIFTDLENVEKLGSIRSSRTYLIDLARSFYAPLVHCGGSREALSEFSTSGWNHLDEMYNSKYFYRDQERIQAGYSNEHTLFADGADLMEGLKNRGYTLEYDEPTDYGFTFTDDMDLGGQTANKISYRFYTNGKGTTMTYDEATGMYTAVQNWYGNYPHSELLVDTNTGEAVPFRNVFVIHAKTTTDAEGYRLFVDLVGEGKGYYACGGQIVPIIWHRDTNTSPFYFTLEDGTPVSLRVGKTYVGILPSSKSLENLTIE